MRESLHCDERPVSAPPSILPALRLLLMPAPAPAPNAAAAAAASTLCGEKLGCAKPGSRYVRDELSILWSAVPRPLGASGDAPGSHAPGSYTVELRFDLTLEAVDGRLAPARLDEAEAEDGDRGVVAVVDAHALREVAVAVRDRSSGAVAPAEAEAEGCAALRSVHASGAKCSESVSREP